MPTSGNANAAPAGLVLLSGLPGSGKTTFAHALAARLPVVHIESDAVRRTLVPTPRYTAAEHRVVFAEVERRAAAVLAGGRIPLIDATNLADRHRAPFVALAQRASATLACVRLVAPEAIVRERLARPREGYSQADFAVYEQLRGGQEPFRIPVVVVDTRFAQEPGLRLVARLLGASGGAG